MSRKQPYSSEGHLALPSRVEGKRSDRGGHPVMLVEDDGLAAFGIRRGDRALLALRAAVEHGDVVAVREEDGVARLWKAYPERAGLCLTRAGERVTLPLDTPVEGVVVAVLRSLPRA